MEASSLGRRVIGKDGTELRVPTLARSRWEDPDVLVVMPQLMVGQTVEDLVAASERLRTTVGSRQSRIISNPTHYLGEVCKVGVSITAGEHLVNGVPVKSDGPYIVVGDDSGEMTADDADLLADMLRAAADRLRAIDAAAV